MRRMAWAVAAALLAAGTGPALAGGDDGAPADGVAGVEWTVVEIGGVPTAGAARSTLTLGRDGTAVGQGGCNRYSTTARRDGAQLRFGAIAATRMACPPGQMEQEARFLAALEATRRWELAPGGHLRLLDGSGAPQVILAQ